MLVNSRNLSYFWSNLQNSSPRKSSGHLRRDSTRLHCPWKLPAAKISASVLIRTLFAKTSEHEGPKLTKLWCRTHPIFKMHLLVSPLAIIGETPLTWTAPRYYKLVEYQRPYSLLYHFAWPASIDGREVRKTRKNPLHIKILSCSALVPVWSVQKHVVHSTVHIFDTVRSIVSIERR